MPSIRAHVRHQVEKLRMRISSSFGYRIKWLAVLKVGQKKEPPSFGLDGLDRALIDLIDVEPNYYVEVGAHDGVLASNTLVLELFYGWQGLLIEPALSTFKKLKKNRSGVRNHLLRAACVPASFTGTSVDLVYSGLMSVTLGLDSDIKEPWKHALEGRRFLRPADEVRIERVPAMTMTRALELAGAPPSIGLLSLDVEGAELDVLLGIDFSRYRIDWILVECRDLERLDVFLVSQGYELYAAMSSLDYLYRFVDKRGSD